jgi:hypothetical protein
MGIEGIGSKGPPLAPSAAPAPSVLSAPAPAAPDRVRPFEVAAPAGLAAPAPIAGADGGGSPLERLRAGALDVAGYVDAKIEEATAHLGAIPGARLDALRDALRERVAADPTLAELVRTAAGHAGGPR